MAGLHDNSATNRITRAQRACRLLALLAACLCLIAPAGAQSNNALLEKLTNPAGSKPEAGDEAGATSESPESSEADTRAETALGLATVGEITAEAVSARIESIKAATDLSETRKSALLEKYQQALGFLTAAAETKAKTTNFAQLRDGAAERLEAIREQLAQPMPSAEPDATLETPLSELELRLKEREAELAAAKQEVETVAREQRTRTQRRNEIPKAIADARSRLQKLTLELSAENQERDAISRAAEVAMRAEQRALESALQSLDAELSSYEARRDLIIARHDLAVREAEFRQRQLDAWQRLVHQSRQADLREKRKALEAQANEIITRFPSLRSVVETNQMLLDARADVVQEIEQAQRLQSMLDERLADLQQAHNDIRQRIEIAGLSEAVGLVLRKQRDDLPDLRRIREYTVARSEKMRQIQLQLIEFAEQREALLDLDARVEAVMAELGLEFSSDDQRAAYEAALRELLLTQRSHIDRLRADLEQLYSRLLDLDTTGQSLTRQVAEIADFIDERVLWIPSASVFSYREFRPMVAAAKWLFHTGNLTAAARSIWLDTKNHPLEVFISLLALGGLIWLRLQAGRRFRIYASYVQNPSKDRFRYVIAALFVTFMTAAVWPGAVWLTGWRLALGPVENEFANALGIGLQRTAWVAFTLEFVRQLCRTEGMADMHFRWRLADLKLVRQQANWLMPVLLPVFLLAATIVAHDDEAWKESLGRGLFMVAMAATAYALARTFWPKGDSIVARLHKRFPKNTLVQLRYVWLLLLLGMPVGLIIISFSGYFYTAWQLSIRLFASFWLLLTLVMLQGMTNRWLLLVGRKLALDVAKRRRAAEAEAREKQASVPPPGATPEIDEPEQDTMDVGVISSQTTKLLHTLFGVALILGLYFIWMPVLPALGLFDQVTLWTDPEFPDNPVTLASLMLAILMLLVTVAAARNIPGLLEIVALQRLPLAPSSKYAIVTVSRYMIVMIGLVIAFSVLGVNWGKIQWLIAAMTVGLGFGLQEIFANFVSGLIIFSEQPIRVGDYVTVGNVSGCVTRIRIRATTILDWDRKELIVPNKEFVTGQLINWTLSDPVLRVTIPIGIAYGSDIRLAEKTLHKVTRSVPNVLGDPEPQVWFTGFGDSSLSFEVRVFIPHIDYLVRVRHALCCAIDDAFRENKIEIAFPQRDLHIRSIDVTLPFRQTQDEQGSSDAKLDGVEVDRAKSQDSQGK